MTTHTKDNGNQQNDRSNFRALADAETFVVVHPDGWSEAWSGGDCCGAGNTDDVDFLMSLNEHIHANYACVDSARVYATGFSNGGFMSSTLACDPRSTAYFAAIAPVSGVLSLPCTPTTTMPYLAIHGTWDVVVPYPGSPGPVLGYTSAVDSWMFWKSHNNCNDTATLTDDSLENTECMTYLYCDGGATVTTHIHTHSDALSHSHAAPARQLSAP